MELQLTPSELERFANALLSAFPNKGELEQLLYFRLDVSLNQIIAPGPYSDVMANLVIWANAQGKIEPLLTAARSKNPGNPHLQKFATEICHTYRVACLDDDPPPQAGGVSITITLKWKSLLIKALITLPVTQNYNGRSLLLDGIPNALNRDQGNALQDLTMMISQLEQLGQLSTGQWPLLLLIDNALPFAQGYSIEQDLQRIRNELQVQYTS